MSDTAIKTPIETGLFSADSHVLEPVEAWKDVLRSDFWPAEGSTAGRWGEKGGGFDPSRRGAADSPYFEFERLQRAVNPKTTIAMDNALEFIMTGIFDRHPNLKIVFVENEIGWVPFAAT